ncbi:hypothetical protein H9P43_003289 [Blastocladiella emersonii ATCC 22665]|nr:hypothetical protein H9P43_003289 [Blastocladiella emersonii ATCC 22665]
MEQPALPSDPVIPPPPPRASDISVVSLLVDLVRRLSPTPDAAPDALADRPTLTRLSTASGEWWNDAAPAPGSGRLRGRVARAMTTLLETSITSPLKAASNVTPADVEDRLAAALLTMRIEYGHEDAARQLENRTAWIARRVEKRTRSAPAGASAGTLALALAFPCTEHQLISMARTGFAVQSTVAAGFAFGVPVHGVAQETLRAVMHLLLAVARPRPAQPAMAPDLIPPPLHAPLDPAAAIGAGLVDYTYAAQNPSLAGALAGDPWRVVYSPGTYAAVESRFDESGARAQAQGDASSDLSRQVWDGTLASLDLPPIGQPAAGGGVASMMRPAVGSSIPGEPNPAIGMPGFPPVDARIFLPTIAEDAPPPDLLDWLPPAPPGYAATPGGGGGGGGPPSDPSWSSSSFSGVPPSHLSWLGTSFSAPSLPPPPPSGGGAPDATATSTETWELGHNSSLVPQPGGDLGTPESIDLAQWLDAGRPGTTDATRRPLLTWEAVGRLATTTDQPAIPIQPPLSYFGPNDLVSPFLTEASPAVHDALYRRFFADPAVDPSRTAGPALDGDVLVRHVHQLLAGIESPTFRWMETPSMPERISGEDFAPRTLEFGFRAESGGPPRVAGFSLGIVQCMLDRFIAIASVLRRLELAATDLRRNVRNVGFFGCALAQSLDEVVDAVRADILALRGEKLGLRQMFVRLAGVEQLLARIAGAVRSTPKKLYQLPAEGSALVDYFVRAVQATDLLHSPAPAAGSPAANLVDAPPATAFVWWAQHTLARLVAPLMHWLRQFAASREPSAGRTASLLAEVSDPYREFPVVWTAPYDPRSPESSFWTTGFQPHATRAAQLHLFPPAAFLAATDIQRVASTLPGVPPGLTAWLADLAWPRTFPQLARVDDVRAQHASVVRASLADSARRIAEARASAAGHAAQIADAGAARRAAHERRWHAAAQASARANAERKRKLLAELQAFAAERKALADEAAAREGIAEVHRIRAHLQSAERWARLVEAEKARLLAEYEAKIAAARKEVERIAWRRKRLALQPVRRGIVRRDEGVVAGVEDAPSSPSVMSVDGAAEEAEDAVEAAMSAMSIASPAVPMPPSPSVRPSPVGVLEPAAETESEVMDVDTVAAASDDGRSSVAPMDVDADASAPAPAPAPEPAATSDTFIDISASSLGLDPMGASELSAAASQFAWNGGAEPSGLISFRSDAPPTTSTSETAADTTKQSAADDEDEDLLSTISPTTMPFALAHQVFRRTLAANLKLTEYALLAHYLADPALGEQFALLRGYFLLDDAGFRANVVDALFDPAKRGQDLGILLARVLDDVPALSFAVNYDAVSSDVHDPKFFDLISLDMPARSPQHGMLVTPTVLAKYNRVFQFLLRVLYLEATAKSLFRFTRDLRQQHRPPPAITPLPSTVAATLTAIHAHIAAIDARLGAFRIEAQHTAAAYWGYAADAAVGESWRAMQAVLRDAANGVAGVATADTDETLADRLAAAPLASVRALHDLHDRALDGILFRCFLRRRQANLQAAFNAQLRTALTVQHVAQQYAHLRAKYLTSLLPGALARQGHAAVRVAEDLVPGLEGMAARLADVHAQIDELATTFRQYAGSTARILRSLEAKSGGAAGVYAAAKEEGAGLDALLVRLDFNGFFESAAAETRG